MCEKCPVRENCPLQGIIGDIDKIKAEVMAGNHQLAVMLCETASQNAGKIAESVDKVLQNADDHVVHQKLPGRNSTRDGILWTIMATIFSRSLETMDHGDRLKRMTTAIGRKLGLRQEKLDELALLSILHDIGKIGIDERILNKPGRLSAEEWDLMKKHSEIGYKITRSTPELAHIADYILHHHERWDGTGYPKALKGCDIPLESRILAIADAYDAMTNNRIYHAAISFETAVDEIRRCAGTQFDPELACLFIELLPSLEASRNYLNDRTK